MASNTQASEGTEQEKGKKFIVADRYQRHDPETHETELEGEELDRFVTQRRNAYAIENYLDPVNVMILWD